MEPLRGRAQWEKGSFEFFPWRECQRLDSFLFCLLFASWLLWNKRTVYTSTMMFFFITDTRWQDSVSMMSLKSWTELRLPPCLPTQDWHSISPICIPSRVGVGSWVLLLLEKVWAANDCWGRGSHFPWWSNPWQVACILFSSLPSVFMQLWLDLAGHQKRKWRGTIWKVKDILQESEGSE